MRNGAVRSIIEVLIHRNHSLFWRNLAPTDSASSKPDAAPTFIKQVEKDFGSLDALKTEVNAKTAAIQGSGWGWLGWNKGTGRLEVVTTANQDPLLSESASDMTRVINDTLRVAGTWRSDGERAGRRGVLEAEQPRGEKKQRGAGKW